MDRFLFVFFVFIALAIYSCRPTHKSESSKVGFENAKKTTLDTAVKIDEDDLKRLVDTLNDYLTRYDTIGSMSNYSRADLKKFKFSKNDIDTLIKESGDNTGEVGGWAVASYFQGSIDDILGRVLNHPKIVRYDLSKIFQHIGITKSDDGKLYNLILPENTGGSYRSNISYWQYRGDNGKVYNFLSHDTEDAKSANPFNTDGFDKIYTLQTKVGVKYLMYGSVQGCNTCTGEYIQLVHFDSIGKAMLDFSFSTGERMNYDNNANEDAQGISYDEKNKIIIMTHNVDDDQSCDCRTDDQRAANEDQPNLRTNKNWICIFKFNGNTFVLDKRKSRSPN